MWSLRVHVIDLIGFNYSCSAEKNKSRRLTAGWVLCVCVCFVTIAKPCFQEEKKNQMPCTALISYRFLLDFIRLIHRDTGSFPLPFFFGPFQPPIAIRQLQLFEVGTEDMPCSSGFL